MAAVDDIEMPVRRLEQPVPGAEGPGGAPMPGNTAPGNAALGDPLTEDAFTGPEGIGDDGPEIRIEYRVIHGYRRAYRIAGSGPAILLIHGIGDNSSTWTDVMRELARDYTVIAPDLLGHGLSEKPRADYSVAAFANGMRDLLVVLGIPRVTVVGHSLGGGVAMQFCYQFPRFVQRLVLVAAGGVNRDVHPALRFASVPGVPTLLQALTLPGARTVLSQAGHLLNRADQSRRLPEQVLPAHIIVDHPDLFRIMGDLTDPHHQAAFIRTLRAVVDWRGQTITMLDRAYLTSRLPMMVMWGTRDSVIPPHHADLIDTAIPHAHLEYFEGAGHFPFRDDLDRFVRLIRDFMTSTEAIEFDPQNWRNLMTQGRQLDEMSGDDAVVEEVLELMEDERSVS